MITINNSILHIIDFNSGITVYSEEVLDIKNKSTETFLIKHIEKSLADTNLKSGTFKSNSNFQSKLINYLGNNLDFIDFSSYIGSEIYTAISKSDKLDSQDLIICDFNTENGRIFGILLFTNKTGFTHHVIKEDGKLKTEIINHYAILPNISQKLDEYAFINLSTSEINFFDKRRYIDGRDVFVIPDIILECTSVVSQKEAIKLVNSITKAVAENYGQNSAIAVSKAKNYIIENIELSENLEPSKIGEEVFNESTIMQEEFLNEVKSSGIPEKVKINKAFAVRTGKNHRIKTDTGIELSFPVDYFENKDYIEFINNVDGTLSIEIKNIGKITNK